MNIPRLPCAEILLIVGVFFLVVVGDALLDVAGVILFKHPQDWAGVLRVVNHPLAPH